MQVCPRGTKYGYHLYKIDLQQCRHGNAWLANYCTEGVSAIGLQDRVLATIIKVNIQACMTMQYLEGG